MTTKDRGCLFEEPWIGVCGKETVPGEDGINYCCEKHIKEKCQVCGKQAFTRCQASIGVMCGIPLCEQCGKGEMCLFHAGSGPLQVIRGLLGGGPVRGIFSTEESTKKELEEINRNLKRLKKFKFR